MTVLDINDQLRRNGRLPNPANGARPVNERAEAVHWEEPPPLTQAAAVLDKPFPVEALPNAIRHFVEGISEQLETPTAMTAAACLSMLAAVCQRVFTVHIKQNWHEPLSMYWCICCDSSERKSPVFKAAAKPLIGWEGDERRRTEKSRIVALQKQRMLEQKLAALEKAAAKGGDPMTQQEAQDAAIELAEHKVPAAPTVYAQDVTSEKLARMLAEHDSRMAVLSTEGGIFETIAGRYSGGVPNMDIFLQAHSGDPVRIERQSQPTVWLEKPALTLALMVQPGVIRDLASKPGFADRGLLARLMYVIPRSLQGGRSHRTDAVPRSVEDAYGSVVRSILDWTSQHREDGELPSAVLKFDADARERFIQFELELEPGFQDGGRFQDIKSWAGKMAGACARIAGLIAVAEWAEACPTRPEPVPDKRLKEVDLVDNFFDNEADGFEGPLASGVYEDSCLDSVSLQQLERAILITQYLLESAIVAFGGLMASGETSLAKRVVEWLRKKKVSDIAKRDVIRAFHGMRAAELDPALELLEQYGYLKRHEQKRGAARWSVNPALWESKA